ncbi:MULTISPECIES: hypothetical protein [unclassified Kitasatospora]|uniref:hypothetical protein n=1 Tax=unclassified Kitasatospora TaxID=2633591 RepID=UPI000A94DC70|nr:MULTISPECIES: hypothetical protein [unclassified Kitasatospora]
MEKNNEAGPIVAVCVECEWIAALLKHQTTEAPTIKAADARLMQERHGGPHSQQQAA